MSSEAVEYVRGIPVVKTFGQTVSSFKKFKGTIDNYERWVMVYTKQLRWPMTLYTLAVNRRAACWSRASSSVPAAALTTAFC